MVKLQLQFIPSITGYVHIQTNPKLSYSVSQTVENAESEQAPLTMQLYQTRR
jgi:hypothetical protein